MVRWSCHVSVWLLVPGLLCAQGPGSARKTDGLPNIVLILADDLGFGELGCYGQKKIRTPNIDTLASQGMRFTQHYAGAPVCAPSRCVLMTGRHLAHAPIRGNKEVRPEGQWPLPDEAMTVAELLKGRGYATGACGKWGLGAPGSTGDPNSQGFDLFFGYNCQREAHNYYPTHLWLNRERLDLDNGKFGGHKKLAAPPDSYDQFYGNEYAPDLMLRAAMGFVRRHQREPFFLYLPFVEPHLALQPPASWVARYPEEWDSEPYLGQKGYLPHPRPRAAYAALISDLDEHVGRVMSLLTELGLEKNTLFLFTSDNGPTHDVGGVDTNFFESAGPLRGRKGSVYEGGLRVPLIARWPGKIAAGKTSDHISGFQDFLPTLVEVARGAAPSDIDGISFLPTLLGKPGQRQHEHLVWEFFEYQGQQGIRSGRFKGVRRGLHKGFGPLELYDLETDLQESNDVAAAHPDVIQRFEAILAKERTPNPTFPIKVLDER